ncbi:MAG: hypothetical protein JO144_16285 [Actinobacteria bacterium]|nr:hypothetical protein [Actinomycetota bacterium]
MARQSPPTDRVLVPTRILAAVIIPFLVLAYAVLYPWPGDTRRLFAWQIRPGMSAMVLGSVYLGGAYFFTRVVRARQWHTVAGGFLPVGTFASLMGLTTILHWDRFLHGNLAFWLWVALYFSTPFLVFAAFARNRREYRPGTPGELLLPPVAAGVIAVAGGLSVLTSALLYLFPHRAIDLWPWQLTPLTARMLAAIFALGLAGLGAVRERRWSAARILVEVAVVMLVLILLAGLRARREFDAGNVLTWLFAAGFVSAAVATVLLYLRMEARARAIGTPAR